MVRKFLVMFMLAFLSACGLATKGYQEKFETLLKSGDFGQAAAILGRWEQENPNDPNLYIARGNLYFNQAKKENVSVSTKPPAKFTALLPNDGALAPHLQVWYKADALPLAKPAAEVSESSGFGVRLDPFTGRPAFHSGQDFAGAFMTPIVATAPGVVSFTGVRSGYGETVEIDHGRGFKTRYAHLAAISVSVGQRVALGQRLGGMGSTGRSTGTHLHYEVWVNGRPENPLRFVKAGDYVQQTKF